MPDPATLGKRFVTTLLRWNSIDNQREMPWKGEKEPYRIWLSEIILQQTRVEQGRAYYERFITAFPTVHHLAAAPDQEILKLWEGLGYYSRCRNLIYTARQIVSEWHGKFPGDYESIVSLKGIGPYTASAIASFAFNLPYAVVDGNVYRVLSRIFDIEDPVDSTEGKEKFKSIADSLLPAKTPGLYNQAIMDFGATICKPLPLCAECFFRRHCAAFISGKQTLLPVKEKKQVIKTRWFHYLIVVYKNNIAIRQRQAGDIWQSLYEPVLMEAGKNMNQKKWLQQFETEFSIPKEKYDAGKTILQHHQKLTHQHINFSFLNIEARTKITIPGYQWVRLSELDKFPFPRTIHKVLLGIEKGYWQRI